MATNIIANLKPGDGDEPIEIKVLRTWTSFGNKSECCFIFVDRNGDAIQAGASKDDKTYFDSIVKVDTCYRLTNYICDQSKKFMATVPHETGIRFGMAANLEEIPDNGFPLYYFKFLPYSDLHKRCEKHEILTDYIGKIENVTNTFVRKQATMRKIRLEDLSGNIIELTIWDKMAVSFNKDAIMSLPTPVIVAVTSTKVTYYQGLQLSGTPATHMYINPDIDEARAMAAEFVLNRNKGAPQLKIEYENSESIEAQQHKNRFKLAELITQNPGRYAGTAFTCKATLKNIDESKGWFYTSCDKCRKKLKPRGTTFVCEDHGHVIEPKYMYAFTANIEDDSANANAVVFNNAATQLLQIECKNLIEHHQHTNPRKLPAPVSSLLGKKMVFQLRFTPSSKQGAVDFFVDNVFEDITAKATKVAIATPTTTPAPPTLTLLQTSTSEYTANQPHSSSARKSLFQTSDNVNKEQVKKQKQEDVA